ncbi:MAG: DNA mismatch repair endonuclease MutL, partial [Oscillospiraceae bacterium]|nr:DNA mismatch repair endonuclease MutL [Oscillospiraceae bacterium]
MPRIEQLSAHVADLIAAGEVVERPASVVKELLENTLDAGASAVTVEIRGGGLTYIRVTDDGCGIEREQLPTAFLRHATSKLRNENDLAAIGTLGFRGEALAAIAGVSRVDIFSRVHGALSGAALHLEGGVPGEVEDAPCPEGTSIIVRDLFFNTPARLKFMKRDSAEATAIAGLVAHLALSHPNVSFKLVRDGKEELHTPGDGQLKSAVYAACGREFALSLLPVSGADGEMRVEGFATKPLHSRGSRSMQTFFVNGRFVKSQLLTAALEESYANRQMKGKFPGCVLNVTLPFDTVDVNVHPAKTVVKFLNERAVFSLVHRAVSAALDGDGVVKPSVELPKAEFFRTMSAQEYRESAPKSAASAPVSAPAPRPPVKTYQSEMGGKSVLSDFVKKTEPPKPTVRIVEPPKPIPAPPKPVPAPVEEPEQLVLVPETAAPWRIAGEVLDTYIICEDAEKNVYLIDKHAAHERVNFDRLRAMQEPIMPQTLLTPAVAELPEDEYAALTEQMALLEE